MGIISIIDVKIKNRLRAISISFFSFTNNFFQKISDPFCLKPNSDAVFILFICISVTKCNFGLAPTIDQNHTLKMPFTDYPIIPVM